MKSANTRRPCTSPDCIKRKQKSPRVNYQDPIWRYDGGGVRCTKCGAKRAVLS